MMAIQNCITIAAGKGGVGKTTVACNIAGLLSLQDLDPHVKPNRVLLVDMDSQGNAAMDLNYEDHDGTALLDALTRGTEPLILKDVRPSLDVMPGGIAMTQLPGILNAQQSIGSAGALLYNVLAPLSAQYDYIIIDTPVDMFVASAALAVSSHLVIPVKSDGGSLVGISFIVEAFMNARKVNPDLEIAGIVLFAVGTAAKAIRREVRADLAEMLGEFGHLVLENTIRHSEQMAHLARKQGRLSYELEAAAQSTEPWYKAVAEGKTAERTAGSAKGVTDDLYGVVNELLANIHKQTKVA